METLGIHLLTTWTVVWDTQTQAMSKAAHSTIPRGVLAMYVPCMDEEAQALLNEYEDS